MKLRRPTVVVLLSIVTSLLLSLHAIGWMGDIRLAQPIHFRWPTAGKTSASFFSSPAPAELQAEQNPVLLSPTVPAPTPRGPPISIIIIWKNGAAAYMPNFVQSVLANKASLEVLWVGVKWAHETTCFDPLEGHPGREGANLKLLCLTEDEYWNMHRDYFCERWGCNDVEKKQVLDAMIERQQKDYQHSFFRLWRGYVFREHINPDARWWGWADPDTFLGNFQTQFPWDADNFDVFIPASPHTLLYLRGHLCFFRMGTPVEDKLNGYPNLISPSAYLEKHKVGDYTAMEEAEFSAYILRNPSISFLLAASSLVDIALSQLALNTPTFATLNGTYQPYALPTPLPGFPHLPVLGLPGTCANCPPTPKRRKTFTDYGITRPVDVRTGEYEGDLWFGREYATEYVPPRRAMRQRAWDVYVGRYAGGGAGVWERLEPPREPVEVPILSSAGRNQTRKGNGTAKGASAVPAEGNEKQETVLLREGLYIHWFHQKHAAWFPGPTLREGQALMSVFKDGAEVWEAGEVVWRSE
ncbi:hypothetical protein CALVIDRAFT_553196 [Calocera viscosa TUFC12733]|uniref:Uncharacterized protein n=1 Tax=Calocera viscosa (strain TUFC12733) TaxID=1330018 RepID=A0A167QHW3_CALVF|nr:hypothetical protein CALVIDRAFT_553196 [Calocera viscosa TUFC12733]